MNEVIKKIEEAQAKESRFLNSAMPWSRSLSIPKVSA